MHCDMPDQTVWRSLIMKINEYVGVMGRARWGSLPMFTVSTDYKEYFITLNSGWRDQKQTA